MTHNNRIILFHGQPRGKTRIAKYIYYYINLGISLVATTIGNFILR